MKKLIAISIALLMLAGCHKNKGVRGVEAARPQPAASQSPAPWPKPRPTAAATRMAPTPAAATSPAPSATPATRPVAAPTTPPVAASEPASKPARVDPREAWPKTYEQAVAALIAGLKEEDRDLFASLPRHKAVRMRPDWPRVLGRRFGLPENRLLMEACAARLAPATQAASQPWQLTIHPDRAAELIIDGAWDLLQRNH